MNESEEVGTIGEYGCACGDFEDENVVIHVHCHRTYAYWDGETKCKCEYGGCHYSVKGDAKKAKETAHRIAEFVSKSYRCDCAVVLEVQASFSPKL